MFRSSPPAFRKRDPENKFTEEHPCRGVISINLLSNFIEITFRYGCSSVNLLHIFRIPFYKSTNEGLLLDVLSENILNIHFDVMWKNHLPKRKCYLTLRISKNLQKRQVFLLIKLLFMCKIVCFFIHFIFTMSSP